MKLNIFLLIVINIIVCFSAISQNSYDDYLITKSNDTIYGIIEWKSNTTITVKNENGKKKYRADDVISFNRGAFKFVSIGTNFPEFLYEVINDSISYYIESHLKRKFTIDYKRKSYIKYMGKLFSIEFTHLYNNYEDLASGLLNDSLKKNTQSVKNIPLKEGFLRHPKLFKYNSNNFGLIFYYIFDEDRQFIKYLEEASYNIYDIEFLIKHANNELSNNKTIINNNLVTKKGDTIKIPVSLGSFYTRKNTIVFKGDKEKLKYKKSDVKKFTINQRNFLNKTIENKDVLLQKIINGKIILFRDSSSKLFYIQKKSSQDLIPVKKDKKYLTLFKDNQTLYKRILENNYEKYEIKSVVRLYNQAK